MYSTNTFCGDSTTNLNRHFRFCKLFPKNIFSCVFDVNKPTFYGLQTFVWGLPKRQTKGKERKKKCYSVYTIGLAATTN